MNAPLTCYARGGDGLWEAICLVFNISVQGESLEEVSDLLKEAVVTYVEDASKEDEPTRSELLLHRRAPLYVRLSWIGGFVWAALYGRRLRNDGPSSTTISFPVASPA